MLDSSMLTFPQHRSAGQEDRKHGNIVDDLVDRNEPALLHVRIESSARGELDQVAILGIGPGTPKRLQLLVDDLPDVLWSAARLTHRGGVGYDFHRRRD